MLTSVALHRLPLLIGLAWLATACAVAPRPSTSVEVRVVAFNDFHGSLAPPLAGWSAPDATAPGGRTTVAAGGVAHLATAVRELRAAKRFSTVVAAGDLISGSPLVSALFLDEPTVTALGEAGLEYSAVGNHEFDRGLDELRRLIAGGCNTQQGCFDGPYKGARFTYLAANVYDKATGKRVFPPYAIRSFGGLPVAFVGAALEATPVYTNRRGIRGLEFRSEADSVNALVPELRRRGVEAIVLLLHDGGEIHGDDNDPTCRGLAGPIVPVVEKLDRAIDVVVSGHTHEAYACRIDGRWVTSAGSLGRVLTTIDLTLDRRTHDVTLAEAHNVVVDTRRFPADPSLTAELNRWTRLAAGRAGKVVGSIRGQFTPLPDAAGESSLGALVANAHLAAMRDATGAQVAFVNPGGLRAPLVSQRPDGGVTVGELFAVQPFGNALVAVTLSGAQLLRILEQQWRAPPDDARILGVAGLRYDWDGTRPLGSRIVPGSAMVGGQPVAAAARYRVAVNEFLLGGGDGFTVFGEGQDPVGGPGDLAALERYIAAAPRSPGDFTGQIRRVDLPH